MAIQSSVLFVVILILLASPSMASRFVKKQKAATAGDPTGIKAQMAYQDECFQKKTWSKSVSFVDDYKGEFLANKEPGAGIDGIDSFKPFDTVLKDGYMSTACVKDYMFSFGDKFGKNKHEYKLGGVSDVSIVHYAEHVPKEDRKLMTQEVCFDFCRTVPDMLYFGITNGRDCYCTPYYKPMESDSTACDEVCEGEPTTMCGGKTKSQIFEMHACNDTPIQLGKLAVMAHAVQENIATGVDEALDAGRKKQELAAELQDSLGQAGDPAASDLMQVAKVSAGELIHLAEETDKLGKSMLEFINTGKSWTGLSWRRFSDEVAESAEPLEEMLQWMVRPRVNFRSFENADKADAMIKFLGETMPKANKSLEELEQATLASGPQTGGGFFLEYGYGGLCTIDSDGCFYPRSVGWFSWSMSCRIRVEGKPKITIEPYKGYNYQTLSYGNAEGWYRYYQYRSWWSRSFFRSDIDTIPKKWDNGYFYYYARYPRNDQGLKVCGNWGPKEDRGLQYYSLMYFVDKEFANVPSTCSGTPVGQPIYGKTYHTCAAACDQDTHNCKGFFYYPKGRGSLCFMFSAFKTATYWTGCPTSMLQTKLNQTAKYEPFGEDEEPDYPICVAKLADYQGIDISPDGSGKSEYALKELKHADRCYK